MTIVTHLTESDALPVNKITGRRARVPVALLLSRRHSPLAVAVYALIDLLSYDGVVASAQWIADRLGVSLSSVEKVFTQLSRPLESEGFEPDQPAWVTTKRRGFRQTAIRRATPGEPFIQMPEHALGSLDDGPRIHHSLLRLYGLYRLLSIKGVCHLSRAEIGRLARVRPDRVGSLTRDLARAALVVTVSRPGRPDAVMPLLILMSTEQRAQVTIALSEQLGAAVDNHGPVPVDKEIPSPSPSGSTPPPDSGLAPPSDSGSQRGDAVKRSHSIEKQGATARELTPSGLARPAWCGGCSGPGNRIAYNEDGFLTGETCKRCGYPNQAAPKRPFGIKLAYLG